MLLEFGSGRHAILSKKKIPLRAGGMLPPTMQPKVTIHKILLALFPLALVVWCASCTSSSPQQETTQQQAAQQQKTQQETTPQAAAPAGPSATSGSDLTARIVGTWELTSLWGSPAPPGRLVLTFSKDGAVQATSNIGSQQANLTGQYSVLDDSHVQLTAPDGTSYVLIYDSNEDTLRGTVQQGATVTFRRRTD